ncbi:unnamed protein product [Cylindrotheca closterium]|uniref:Alpha-type protein kinase domain-containing protein n=1 Tax=Cylindrotheca closterium TaxID=2856 RepID=A0AAD2FNP8_9STRA|nr:unnamed protein product [Cylindrotheca closterium]
MRLQNTVYFRDNYGSNIEKGDAGKVVALQDSEGLYSVILTKDRQVYKVHPKCISILKPMGTSVFKSFEQPFRELNERSPTAVRKSVRSSSSQLKVERRPAPTLTSDTTPAPKELGSPERIYPPFEAIRAPTAESRPRRSMEDIRAEIVKRRQEQREMMRQKYGSQVSTTKKESEEPTISDIRAIKHGHKEVANPGRDGSKRWRYTHKGVEFITDETSRHEITSWRVSGEEDAIIGLAEIQLAGSRCHVVLIVDHSGSMRTSDVPGYDTRAHAVYECLKRDFVEKQLKSGALNGVIVTLISMSNTATVQIHKKTLDDSLIHDLQRLSKRQPKLHGNYISALDKALEITKADTENMSSLLFLFFSDGAPSDHQIMKCAHGINVFSKINQRNDRKMEHTSRNQAWKCLHEITNRVETECCERVKSIGQVFGPDQVIFRTLASLSTLRTEGGHLALTRRPDKVVDANQKIDHTTSEIFGRDGCWMYADIDIIGKYEFKANDPPSRQLQRVHWKEDANGIAFLQHPFAEGEERFVYRCAEIKTSKNDYTSAASRDNTAERRGLRLVAKEAKDLEKHHQGRKFHQTFARIQTAVGKVATSFTKRLPHARPESNINFLDTNIYGCYDRSYRRGQAWILVEPELDGKFTKWNDNAGNIKTHTSNQGTEFLDDFEESDEEDEETAPIQVENIPQAFSHFSYEHSKGKQLICDLQGVWNADDGFVLTDPVIHYVSSKGRKHINGATDKGEAGMKKFFQTHVCSSLCKRMSLPGRTSDTLMPAMSELS